MMATSYRVETVCFGKSFTLHSIWFFTNSVSKPNFDNLNKFWYFIRAIFGISNGYDLWIDPKILILKPISFQFYSPLRFLTSLLNCAPNLRFFQTRHSCTLILLVPFHGCAPFLRFFDSPIRSFCVHFYVFTALLFCAFRKHSKSATLLHFFHSFYAPITLLSIFFTLLLRFFQSSLRSFYASFTLLYAPLTLLLRFFHSPSRSYCDSFYALFDILCCVPFLRSF